MRNLIRLLTVFALVAIFAAALTLMIGAPQHARADTTFTVNTLDDHNDGTCNASDCTLREAINAANSTPGHDTIVFTVTGVIPITTSLPTLSDTDNSGVTINGDTNGDGVPDVALYGSGTTTGTSGIRILSANNVIQSLAIYGFNGFGISITSTQAFNNQILSNTIGLDLFGAARGNGNDVVNNGDGIIIRNGAHDNVVRANTLGSNLRHGVSLSGGNTNTVTQNYVGVTSSGADRGNGAVGIRVHTNSTGNLIQENQVKYNDRYGVELTGNGTQGNRVIGNAVMYNNSMGVPAQAGIVNDRTHGNSDSLVLPTGDNLIESNQVISNTGTGIYNIGASPQITGNTVMSNTSYGIYNLVDYGALPYSPVTATDDLLAMPGIYNNVIDLNGNEGIRSLDTVPLNRATLTTDNVIGNNSGFYDVHQIWYGAVEVLTGTTTITHGLDIAMYSRASTVVQGSVYASAGGTPEKGIWAKPGASYNNVTTWFVIDEYIVQNNGALVQYSPYTVSVSGACTGSMVFSFDAISTTHPISPDRNLPFGLVTGITNVVTHTLHRYQIAELNFAQDSDNDGISDPSEGGGDSDGDGVPDYLDADSDNDTIPDNVEGTGDADGDGIPNYLDPDSDGNGIPDKSEPEPFGDQDGDGIPNFLDTDDDGDGIPDWMENGCTTQPVNNASCGNPNQDTDGDGIPDSRDPDSDGDGIPDWMEAGCTSQPVNNATCPNADRDTDGDGIPDYRDPDSDGDGIPDWREAGCVSQPTNNATCPNADRDTDGDGTPDRLDTDSDGDGILDADEYYYGAGDIAFCINTSLDSDGDTTPNCTDNDADGDGIPNYRDPDSDGDGTPDSQEKTGYEQPVFPDHENVPAWLDPVYHLYLPVIMRN